MLKLLGRFSSTLNMNIPELIGDIAICAVSGFLRHAKTTWQVRGGNTESLGQMPHLSVRMNVFFHTDNLTSVLLV